MATGKDLRKTSRPQSGNAPEKAAPPDVEVQQHNVKLTSGPLPSPEVLGLYEAVSPGLAEDIVIAFRAEYQQRHHLETIAMNGDIEAMRRQSSQVSRGQWLGFIIAIVGLLSGSALIYLGHDAAGATLGAGGLASVLAAYFKGGLPDSGQKKEA